MTKIIYWGQKCFWDFESEKDYDFYTQQTNLKWVKYDNLVRAVSNKPQLPESKSL